MIQFNHNIKSLKGEPMNPSGTITLKEGIGQKSGQPYTALQLKIGKWTQLHFPTQFEKDYLVEYLKDNQGTITLDANNETLKLVAGDYTADYKVESPFEYKYIVDFFRIQKEQATTDTTPNDNLDLSQEDPIKENPFN